MYSKIVDTVAVTSRQKPLGGGRCENYWLENSSSSNGLNKTLRNRNRVDPEFGYELNPSVSDTLTRYQFKGFEFGNWMTQADRYDVFRAFQHCALVLSDFLGSKNLGFDYNIGVAFGARGLLRSAAHYEPCTNIINMTKEKGAGSLLHEYAHALDYCIGSFFDQCKHSGFASLSGGRSIKQWPMNVGGQFRYMMNKILLYVRTTDSYNRLKKRTNNSDYWCNSTELFARLTEAYFAYYYNAKYKDYYLVKSAKSMMQDYGDGAYLTKDEVDVIKPELDAFFTEVGKLLNDKCELRPCPFPEIAPKVSAKKKTATKATTKATKKKTATKATATGKVK